MKRFTLIMLVGISFLLCGCGENSNDNADNGIQGWHHQGRNCLVCHNSDLNPDKHLLYGGTIYKNESVPDQNDLTNMCGGDLVLNFLDPISSNVVFSSNDYKSASSNGYKAKGNIFILQRELRLLSAGTYNMQITTASGTQLALSGGHSFTSQDYDTSKLIDFSNRLSCNSCHSNGSGIQAPIFVQNNSNLCK